jgi:hypothetical protein
MICDQISAERLKLVVHIFGKATQFPNGKKIPKYFYFLLNQENGILREYFNFNIKKILFVEDRKIYHFFKCLVSFKALDRPSSFVAFFPIANSQCLGASHFVHLTRFPPRRMSQIRVK